MAAVIYEEQANPNPNLASEYPFIIPTGPDQKSFYLAIGFAIMTQLSRVSINNRKQVIGSMKKYANEGLSNPIVKQTKPEIENSVKDFLKWAEYVEKSDSFGTNFSSQLRQISNLICEAFQVMLSEIFSKSSKISEADAILKGEVVVPSNKYYFQNFATSLTISISLFESDGRVANYVDEKSTDRLNINIYVLDTNPKTYAVMKHMKEVIFDNSGSQSYENDMPFIFIRTKKPNFAPIPNQIPITNQIPISVPIVPQSPSAVPNVQNSSNPLINDSLSPEENLIDLFSKIFSDNMLIVTKENKKFLKKTIKNAVTTKPSLNTENLKKFNERLDLACNCKHSPEDFIILFKSCGKRHCKTCLINSDNYLCACGIQIKGLDSKFLLGKSAKCPICDMPVSEEEFFEKNYKTFHKKCIGFQG